MGCDFQVISADIDESRLDAEAPVDYGMRLAQQKAIAVGQRIVEEQFEGPYAVLSADTIVVCDGEVLGKPSDFEHAQTMWQMLSDNSHRVLTAICLYIDDRSTAIRLHVRRRHVTIVTTRAGGGLW